VQGATLKHLKIAEDAFPCLACDQNANLDSCEDLRDLLRELYFIFMTFLVSYSYIW
jgi:hypothetical protein